MRETFCNTREDCDWLRETHLRGLTYPPFKAFMLQGNEDCPTTVTLYADVDPRYDDVPVAMFTANDNGDLE